MNELARDPAADAPRRRPRLGLTALTALALATALAGLFTGGMVTVLRVGDGGMEPALSAGDRVVALSPPHLGIEIRRGDVIAFTPSAAPGAPPQAPRDETVVRRVLASGDDVVEIRDRTLWVNGARGGLVPPRHDGDLPADADLVPERVAARQLWVLGDAGTASVRSGLYGPVQLEPSPRLPWLRITPWSARCALRPPVPPGFPACG